MNFQKLKELKDKGVATFALSTKGEQEVITVARKIFSPDTGEELYSIQQILNQQELEEELAKANATIAEYQNIKEEIEELLKLFTKKDNIK